MGKIGKPQTLTVNCQSESMGVLTFCKTKDGFYDFSEWFQPSASCIESN